MVSPAIQTYFSKMKGQRYDPKKLKAPPKPPTRIQVLVSSFVGSFVGIAIVASLTYNAQWFLDRNIPVISGAFGASAVLIYGAIEAPLSQPRNVSRCLPPPPFSFFLSSLSLAHSPLFLFPLDPRSCPTYVSTNKQTVPFALGPLHCVLHLSFFFSSASCCVRLTMSIPLPFALKPLL